MPKSSGSIIRRAHDKQHPYVLISRALAEDETLSLEARGLMLYLLAKPPDWQIMMGDLQRAARCGRDQTRRILHECEAAGYIVREQTNNPATGRWQWVSMVYETPQSPSTENPSMGSPSMDEPSPEKASIYQVRTVASNQATKEPTEPVPPQSDQVKVAMDIQTWAYQHRIRVTPEQVRALAAAAGSPARWQAVSAGAGALADVQQRLGG